MFGKKRAVFILEIHLPVVLFLPGNVLPNSSHVGFAHGKCTITGLPGKCRKFPTLGLDPFGRGFFDILDNVADGNGSAQIQKYMDMIFDRIYYKVRTSRVFDYNSHVSM
jgi:hypothetical protein